MYLGTHHPHWLARVDVPLFVSRRTLAGRKTFPRALGPWAEDSGGFSELTMHGAWQTTPAQYVSEVRRHRDEVGNLEWAAIQDWMCEPFMLAKTGLSVEEHQRRTIDSYATLLDLAPEIPWAPVLQGWEPDDYLRHLDAYGARGFDLRRAPVVGVGSVCRRQHMDAAILILRSLQGLKLHGFGFKVQGLERAWNLLASSDSLAWSFNARHSPPLPGCTHKSCANCPRYALRWYERVQRRLQSLAAQGSLFSEAA